MQFLIGCAHLRKQPLFQCACGTAFEKCMDPETSEISRAQLADVLRLTMLLPSDDGVSCHRRCAAQCCYQPIIAFLFILGQCFLADDEAIQDIWRRWWRKDQQEWLRHLHLKVPVLDRALCWPDQRGGVHRDCLMMRCCVKVKAGHARRRQGGPTVYTVGFPVTIHF